MRTLLKWTILFLFTIAAQVCLILTFVLARPLIEAYRHQKAVERAVKIINSH